MFCACIFRCISCAIALWGWQLVGVIVFCGNGEYLRCQIIECVVSLLERPHLIITDAQLCHQMPGEGLEVFVFHSVITVSL